MRRNVFTVIFLAWVILILACAGFSQTAATPTPSPTEMQVIIPYDVQTARPSPTRTFTPTPNIFTPRVFPRWVADFSDPILRHVESQHPVFADEFSGDKIEYKKTQGPTKVPTLPAGEPTWTPTPKAKTQTYTDPSYFVLNKGWFFIAPDSEKNPHYAFIENGSLVLRLPTGGENKDMWVYSPHLMAKNFVLKFDLEFGETQPEDSFKFQFEQGKTERFSLELKKDKTWIFRWGVGESEQQRGGIYEYFAMPRAQVLLIVQGEECAVYLDNIPLDYFDSCRVKPNEKTSQQSATFHLLAEPGHSAALMIDNLMLWDLDQKRP